MAVIEDLDEAALRARGSIKWSAADPGVLPAWVAETDFALAEPIVAALTAAVRDGATGYPTDDDRSGVPEALAGYAARAWSWELSPHRVVLSGDVMAGMRIVLEALCEKAPVVVPTPTYPPFLDVVPLAGLERIDLPLDADASTAELDLDRLGDCLRQGARTVLLCNPHNPWGRAFTRTELEGLRDVALRHGARVISDEIHAPLVLPGAVHTPYLDLEGTGDHAVTVLSASKAWNVPGLKCAQVVTGNDRDAERLRSLPPVANHGVSSLGVVANRTAWDDGEPWLVALLERLDANRSLLAELVTEHLPLVRIRRLEATYLAWLDARAYGHTSPAALALSRGRVMVNEGTTFGPGGEGGVRLNIATSPERVREAVARLARAWEPDV